MSDYLFEYVEKYRQNDGSWYQTATDVSLQLRINGAMKMVTAYQAAGRSDIGMEKELIDLCLSAVNDANACDNFNIVCVLNQCGKNINHRYREIEEFALNRLDIYKEYYWPQWGGFPFRRGKQTNSIIMQEFPKVYRSQIYMAQFYSYGVLF